MPSSPFILSLPDPTIKMTVVAALNNFGHAVVGVVHSLINAVLAVFQALLSLGNELLMGGVKLVHAVIALFTDLIQDTLGLVFGELYRPSVVVVY